MFTRTDPKPVDRPNKFGESAAKRHEDLRKTVIEQLLELSTAVAENNQQFHAEGSTNWGYVGDLSRVSEMLSCALNKE